MAVPEPRLPTEHDLHQLAARALVSLVVGIGALLLAGGAAQIVLGPGHVLGSANLVLGLGFWLAAALAWWLGDRGWPQLASGLLVGVSMLALAGQAWATGLGVHSLALAGGSLLVVLAGALLGLGPALAAAALNGVLVVGLFAAERSGLLPGLSTLQGTGPAQRALSQLMLAVIALAVALLVVRLLAAYLERARSHERQLAELLNLGSDWTWEMDPRGRLLWLSPSFEPRTGRRIDEFLHVGEPGGPVLLEEADRQAFDEDLAAGRAFQGRLLAFRCADGTLLCVRADGGPVFGDGGRISLWRGVSRNVTREYLAQKAQRRSEALLDRLVRFSPDAITVARLDDGRILLANPAFVAQSGIAEAEAIGHSAYRLGLWRDPAEPLRLRAGIEAGGGVVRDLRSRVHPRNGGPRDVLLTAAAFDWDADPVTVIITRDVTDSERARLEGDAILDNATVGIALVRDGRFGRVNPCFERLFGREPGSLGGRPAHEVWPADALPETTALGAAGGVERELTWPGDGTARRLQLRVGQVGEAGPGSVWIVEDVTERRRAERALADAMQQAEAANHAKSRFLATMSHEIRTPLNGVLGLARLLQDPALDPARRGEFLGHLVGAAEQLNGIVSDVLDLSKIESGHVQIERVGFDLRQVVASAFHTFVPLGRERGIACRCVVDEVLPPRVVGDPVRVRQILSNYLANALKFTRRGEIVLRVGPAPEGLPQVRLEVQDSGIGVAPAVRERLFRPFAQADDSTTRRYGGTGLGLSICHELATRMGGAVGVDSDGASGSRFWADLPLPADAQAPAAPPPTEAAAAAAPLAGLRVLLAEDNPVNLLVAGAMLGRMGATVLEAHNGSAAVALAREHAGTLHAVLMDLHMPGLDGLAATRQLREDPQTAQLPVFAFSAAVLEQERRAAAAAGMNGFVAKPIDAGELLRVLQPLQPQPPQRASPPPSAPAGDLADADRQGARA